MDKLLTISDVYQPPTANEMAAAYSANLQNRLARMQMAEYEKKIARETQRSERAKQYFSPGTPQIGIPGTPQMGTPAIPAETTWGAPQMSTNAMSTYGQSPTGPYAPDSGELSPFATRYSPGQAASPDYAPAIPASPDYQAAVPARQDLEGYQRASYSEGDIEEGRAVQAQIEAQKEKAFTLSQKQIEPRMNFYKQFLDSAIKEGNNNTVQQVLERMKADPALKNAIPADFSITVSPNGETQTVLDVKPGMPAPDGRPILDPFTGQPVPPGKYKITAKGTQISKIEPIDTGLPYKIGERQKFTGAGGAEYEGTFKGLDERGEPRFESQVKVQKPVTAVQGLGFGDKEIIKKTLTELPKLKREAISGQTAIDQVDRALELISKGVTGKGGQLKAFLAPYAEMAGVNTENIDDSQKFQLLTRAIVGPMRLELIGPGPVSEWEQQLMSKISGGGGATKGAAQELLSYYKKLANDKVNNYNDILSGVSEIDPNIGKVYKQIQPKGQDSGAPTTSGPTVGAIVKGYRFKGGDPANKVNWEKL